MGFFVCLFKFKPKPDIEIMCPMYFFYFSSLSEMIIVKTEKVLLSAPQVHSTIPVNILIIQESLICTLCNNFIRHILIFTLPNGKITHKSKVIPAKCHNPRVNTRSLHPLSTSSIVFISSFLSELQKIIQGQIVWPYKRYVTLWEQETLLSYKGEKRNWFRG